MGRDFYQLLGVGKTADDAELKKGTCACVRHCRR